MLPFLPFLVLLLAGAILMALRFVQLRRALLRARAGEAQFRLLAEHGRDAAFLLDAATLELIYISPAAQRLTGHDLPALREHAAQLAADVPARLQRWRDGDASRLTVLREVELPHADGHQRPWKSIPPSCLRRRAGRDLGGYLARRQRRPGAGSRAGKGAEALRFDAVARIPHAAGHD